MTDKVYGGTQMVSRAMLENAHPAIDVERYARQVIERMITQALIADADPRRGTAQVRMWTRELLRMESRFDPLHLEETWHMVPADEHDYEFIRISGHT